MMPRVEKFEKQRPLHTYKCKKGHTYQDFGPWEVTIVDNNTRTTSGPLCPYCYIAWLHRNFGAPEEIADA